MTAFNYQLYCSRNHGPLPETLKMLAAAGYAGVEGFGALYDRLGADDLARLRADLDALGLSMPTGHFGLDLIETDPVRTIAIAKALGVSAVYAPFLMPADRPADAAGWAAFGRRVHEAGRPLLDAGLAFGWHNHDFEFKPLADGSLPIEHMFEAAPDLSWEADIAWVARGGADPFAFIERFGPRITAVHVKDVAPAGEKADEDGWADVGTGVLPWPDLMKALRATPAKHFVMEHDKPSDDGRFARASITAASKY
jgi:sugar phosphate isomerase/epimerase